MAERDASRIRDLGSSNKSLCSRFPAILLSAEDKPEGERATHGGGRVRGSTSWESHPIDETPRGGLQMWYERQTRVVAHASDAWRTFHQDHVPSHIRPLCCCPVRGASLVQLDRIHACSRKHFSSSHRLRPLSDERPHTILKWFGVSFIMTHLRSSIFSSMRALVRGRMPHCVPQIHGKTRGVVTKKISACEKGTGLPVTIFENFGPS